LAEVSNSKMCRRRIIICPMCKVTQKDLSPCSAYDKEKYPNMFGSGWFNDHVKQNVNNVRNSIKLMFCTKCETKNTIYTQPECDAHYKKEIQCCFDLIKSSFAGKAEMRNRIGIGYIFLN
jgi:hypothetical protein